MTEHSYLQQLLSLPSVDRALLSPDGRSVAFMWYRIHANVDVFVSPCDGSQPPMALTNTPEFTRLVSWAFDSQAIIVAQDHDGDERVSLYRVDLNLDEQGKPNPGPMQILTPDRPPYFLRGGDLAPGNSALYYAANYDFEKEKLIEASWIYRHDLLSGEKRILARPIRPAYTWPELNRIGTHLIYYRKDRHPAGIQVHCVDIDGNEDREILNFGDQAKVIAHWLPDSENILTLAELQDGESRTYKALGLYHLPSHIMRWLVNDPHRNIETAWVTPDGQIVVDEVLDAIHYPTWINPQSGREIQFPRLQGNLLPFGRTQDCAWIGRYYSSKSPDELVRFDWDGTPDQHVELFSLTRVWERTSLTPDQLNRAETVHWNSYDGLQIQGWLYRATPNPGRAIILIHGGPTSRAEEQVKPIIQYLLSRGFNVLDVNYRGSTGFGVAFREAIKIDGWGGREQQDIAAGAQALIQAGLAQPGKIGVFGTSYGGYSTWYLITHFPPELISAAAPICGMTDLVIDYETTRPDLRPYSEEMMGGRPDQAPKRYYQRSPINYVQNIQGSLLIIQGGQDPNVTPENVRQVVARLNQHQIAYELLVFDDEGHGIIKPQNQFVLYQRLANFFDRALDQ